jgi:hypothetical protein
MTPSQTPSLLSALADELALTLPVVEGLSALVVEHAIQADALHRPRILIQAQAVDDLSQRLVALRDLTEALSHGAKVEAALDTVSLAEMAARLRLAVNGTASNTMPVASATHGDLMLFDQP